MKKFFVIGIVSTLIPAILGIYSSITTKAKPVVLAAPPSPVATARQATLTLAPVSTLMPTPQPEAGQPVAEVTTPKPIPTPIPATSQEINGFIESFAGQYATDPNVLRHIAICESGFRPNAVNGPYVGLFQFGPVTWQNTRKLIGENPDINLRYDAKASVQTAAYLLASRGRNFWPNCKP